MKSSGHVLLLAAIFLSQTARTATITYTYDAQHRLVQASYSASEKVCYSYDAANNLDLEVTITDSKHMKSFLYWLSAVWPDRLEPGWLRQSKV